jgi:hypothetical protein
LLQATKFKLYQQLLSGVLNAIIKKLLGGLSKLGVQMSQRQDFSGVPSVLAHGVNMINDTVNKLTLSG